MTDTDAELEREGFFAVEEYDRARGDMIPYRGYQCPACKGIHPASTSMTGDGHKNGCWLVTALTGHASADRWLRSRGAALAAEVDRLWPDENDPGYRAQCLSEEAGEVSRAITKRRHAEHAPYGRCKGLTVDQWNDELRVELAQTLGVLLDIAHREGIGLVDAVDECVEILRRREAGS